MLNMWDSKFREVPMHFSLCSATRMMNRYHTCTLTKDVPPDAPAAGSLRSIKRGRWGTAEVKPILEMLDLGEKLTKYYLPLIKTLVIALSINLNQLTTHWRLNKL
jgi:hypothetical protein